MHSKFDRKLILEDGKEYLGYGFGGEAERVCEIVFNTSMAGYQEILTDPSYTDQAVVMTYPLIGIYGVNPEDGESICPGIGGLIVREYEDGMFHFRAGRTLEQEMRAYHIPGIAGVDTRALTRSIRDYGSRKALLTGAETSLEDGLARLRHTEAATDQVQRAGSRKIEEKTGCRAEKAHVVLIDCGVKKSIVTSLLARGCRVTIVPWDCPAADIRALEPDGILISNGPGDPRHVPETVQTVRALLGCCPVFGICLGHQILALAYGAEIWKLKFGHRGGNHPVRELHSGKIGMTSQNHSYAVDARSLSGTPLEVTHVNLLDATVEGIFCRRDRAWGVQFHPEGAPGPGDYGFLFDRFMEEITHAEKE